MSEEQKTAKIIDLFKKNAKPAASQQAEGYGNVQVSETGGSQAIKGNGNVQVSGSSNKISIRTTRTKVEIAPPPSSIGGDPMLRDRITKLFNQINTYRHDRLGSKLNFGAIYGNFARAFGLKAADWKSMWLWDKSRADEVITWLEQERDDTQPGRIAKAAKRAGYKHTRGHLFRLESEALEKLGLDGDSEFVRDWRYRMTGCASRSELKDVQFANWVAGLEAEVREAHGESEN